jgi:peptidoglycan/LPS O-acetylase OafA/YrhL
VSRARIQGIDLLRGVAVLLVMLRHAFPDVFAGAGIVGVVMFFSLSGHLITGLLIDEFERTGTVRLRRFYANRALRLVPALLTLVAVFAVVTLLADPLRDAGTLPRSVLLAVTWTGNLGIPGASDAVFHLWTLATEEQFYLLWPAALLVAARAGKTRAVTVALSVLGLAACVATLVWAAPHPDHAYALPTSWVLCFLVGAASRVWRADLKVPHWLAPSALAILLALSVLPVRGHNWTYLVVGPLVAALTALIMLRWSRLAVVARVLRPLAALGTVSYGAYLYNYPLTLWFRPWGTAGALLAFLLTLAAAAASWQLVERPVARWRARRSQAASVGSAQSRT